VVFARLGASAAAPLSHQYCGSSRLMPPNNYTIGAQPNLDVSGDVREWTANDIRRSLPTTIGPSQLTFVPFDLGALPASSALWTRAVAQSSPAEAATTTSVLTFAFIP
jgi:hypothetical protein